MFTYFYMHKHSKKRESYLVIWDDTLLFSPCGVFDVFDVPAARDGPGFGWSGCVTESGSSTS